MFDVTGKVLSSRQRNRSSTNKERVMIMINRLPCKYSLLIPNKGAKSRLREKKRKKIQIIPLNLDLDLLFRISEA